MFQSEKNKSQDIKFEAAELVVSDFDFFRNVVAKSKFANDASKCTALEIAFFANLSLSDPDTYAKFRDTFVIFPAHIDLSKVDEMEKDDRRILADNSDFNEVMNDVRNALSSKRTTSSQ